MNDELQQIGSVALACALGAIIGIEREFADKPAGLRTHILVCGASALLMLLGDGVVDRFEEESKSTISADPIRIIQAIVVGISFLGAGTIIHHGNRRVEGLTTAASILLTSGIGIATALEQYYLAVGISLMTLLILVIVGAIERRIPGRKGSQLSSESCGEPTALSERDPSTNSDNRQDASPSNASNGSEASPPRASSIAGRM